MTLRNTIFAIIGTVAVVLSAIQFSNERSWLAIIVLAGAILWGVGFWRGIQGPTNFGLLIFSVAAAFGIADGNSLWLMIVCLLLTLVAWDLSFLSEIVAEVEVLDMATLYRAHFNRLGTVIFGGLVLSGTMFIFQFNLRPIWAIFIGLFVIYGLSRTIRFLRQASD